MAEVSGPGKQSKRTDLGVLKQSTQPIQSTQPAQSYTGGAYGNNKAMAMQQAAAPLAGNPMPKITSITAPTERPDEPITSGIDMGPGPGSASLNLPNNDLDIIQVLKNIAQYDRTGDTELIIRILDDSGY